MSHPVHGLKDIHTIIANERKLGGAIEADMIRLRTGEEFFRVVICSIDMTGSAIYSLSFITETGNRYIVHVNDISMISQPTHKRIHEVRNEAVRQAKTEEKIKVLTKLFALHGSHMSKPMLQEIQQLVEDIGLEAARDHLHPGIVIDQRPLPALKVLVS